MKPSALLILLRCQSVVDLLGSPRQGWIGHRVYSPASGDADRGPVEEVVPLAGVFGVSLASGFLIHAVCLVDRGRRLLAESCCQGGLVLLIVGGGLLFSAVVFRIGLGTVHPDEVEDSRRARQAFATLRWGRRWFLRIGIVVLIAGALAKASVVIAGYSLIQAWGTPAFLPTALDAANTIGGSIALSFAIAASSLFAIPVGVVLYAITVTGPLADA